MGAFERDVEGEGEGVSKGVGCKLELAVKTVKITRLCGNNYILLCENVERGKQIYDLNVQKNDEFTYLFALDISKMI